MTLKFKGIVISSHHKYNIIRKTDAVSNLIKG